MEQGPDANPTSVIDRGAEDGSSQPSRSPAVISGAALCIIVGLLAVAMSDEIAALLERLLPWRAQVSSAGTAFPHFNEIGSSLVGRTGFVLCLAPVIAVVVHFAQRLDPRGNAARVLDGGLATLAGVITWWVATPHNGFPTNSRIHWVDYNTDRDDRFFYAAGRLPRWLFYESPPVWQGINAAIIVLLVLAIGRQLGFSRAITWLLAISMLAAGNITRFMNTAEDVFVNVALALLFLALVVHGRPALVGLGMLALVLGRPQFIVVFPVVLLAHLGADVRRARRIRRESVIAAVTIGAVGTVGIVVSQVLFTLLGRRYFLANGNYVDVEELANLEARPIDGFTIFPFSGSYALHLIWVLPAVTLALAVVGAVLAPRLPQSIETAVYCALGTVAAMILVHEARPLLYFNIRYLTYLLPFLMFVSWTVPVALRESAARERPHPWFAGAVALALVAPFSVPSDALDLRERLSNRPEVELLALKDELRELADGRLVVIDFASAGSLNYVAYVLRRPIDQVAFRSDGGVERESVLIRPREAPSGADAGLVQLLQTDSLVIEAPADANR